MAGILDAAERNLTGQRRAGLDHKESEETAKGHRATLSTRNLNLQRQLEDCKKPTLNARSRAQQNRLEVKKLKSRQRAETHCIATSAERVEERNEPEVRAIDERDNRNVIGIERSPKERRRLKAQAYVEGDASTEEIPCVQKERQNRTSVCETKPMVSQGKTQETCTEKKCGTRQT